VDLGVVVLQVAQQEASGVAQFAVGFERLLDDGICTAHTKTSNEFRVPQHLTQHRAQQESSGVAKVNPNPGLTQPLSGQPAVASNPPAHRW